MKHILLVTVFSLLLSTPALAQFSDTAEHEYQEAVQNLFARRLVSGYQDGLYHPDTPINRVEFVKIVVGALFTDEEIRTCLEDLVKAKEDPDLAVFAEFADFQQIKFTDTDYDDWYGNYLCVAQLEEIVGGYEDGTFRPEQRVNFAEAATILARGFNVLKGTRHITPDPIWYRPYVQDLGDVRAIPLSISGFDAYITRGEMAEMIYRLITLKESERVLKKPFLTYEEIARGSDWPILTDEERHFTLYYSSEWPKPELSTRREFDRVIPVETSDWRYYMGPTVNCQGFGECIERVHRLDGFDVTFKEGAEAVVSRSRLTEVLSDRIINDSRVIVFEQQEPDCTHRAALIFGESYLYRLHSYCAGDVPARARMLERLIERFHAHRKYKFRPRT